MSSLKAAIFDLDGLMLDTESVSRMGWQKALADFGFSLDDSVYFQIIGLIVPDMETIFKKVFGDDFPLEQVNNKRLLYMYDHFDKFGVTVKKGLFDLLDFLDKTGLAKAVATSSCRQSAFRKLTTAALLNRFDVVVTGDDVQKGKPAPDIFLAAAKKLNVPAADCLVFEDSENGIRAANSAGMTIIVVPDVKQPERKIAALARGIFPSLSDTIPFLRQLLAASSS